MKKGKIILMFVIFALITGCGISDKTYQTSFKVNEDATIDYFNITCTGFEKMDTYNDEKPKNGVFLKVNYKLTSLNSKATNIVPSEFFKLVNGSDYIDASGEILPLSYNSEAEYSVVFDVNDESTYKVLFFSNVATNNIAFDLK